MSIYLFSRPIRSGKTTELLHWCDKKDNMLGILMPDIDGCRHIFDIKTKTAFTAECTDSTKANEPLTTVGKFTFYTKAFEKANLILSAALQQNPNWLLIDEAGKLELKGEGFYASVAEAVKLYSNTNRPGNLLITVRDSLCDEIVRYFNISNYTVIESTDSIPL